MSEEKKIHGSLDLCLAHGWHFTYIINPPQKLCHSLFSACVRACIRALAFDSFKKKTNKREAHDVTERQREEEIENGLSGRIKIKYISTHM